MTPYYDDGQCVIYHGEALDVLRQLPEASCDVLLTDPPYSSGGMFRSDRVDADPSVKYSASWVDDPLRYGTFGGDNRDQRSFMLWVGAWSHAALRATRPGGHAFIFADWRQLPATTDALQMGGWIWRGMAVWEKGSARPHKGRFYNTAEFIAWGTNGKFEHTDNTPSVFIKQASAPRGDERKHPTQKPTSLLTHILSVVEGEAPLTVLDPFMGSGSTIVAARELGHRVIGIEVEERYCEIAAKRLDQGVLDFTA